MIKTQVTRGRCLSAAVLFLTVAGAPVSAQTARDVEADARTAAKAPKFCRGNIEGRWRVRCYAPSMNGTLIVDEHGRVAKIKDPRERWSSFKFPASRVVGGRLHLHDPIRDNSPKAINQCYMEGTVRLVERKRGPKHKVIFINMFITKDNHMMSGSALVDGGKTGCTAIRY